MKINVCEPVFGQEEINAVVKAMEKGEISGSFGKSIPEFESEFAKYCGCKYGVAVTSGTTALQLAVAAAGLGPGDEVLLSASTNIATALAIVHNGATPVPVDSENETWNMDLDKIESLITKKTKAIIPVHLFGHPVEMQKLMKIARKHKLIVIEDCAESHGATSHGQMTGSFGDMACFSFYANKIITTGEGGMITTNSKDYYNKLCLLRNLAFTRPRFRHEEVGYNFRMTGMQAAIGLVQLKKIEEIIKAKRGLAKRYDENLANLSGLKLPVEKKWAKNVYWMYAIEVLPEFGMNRDQLVTALAECGIETRTFFCSMSDQPCLRRLKNFKKTNCAVAERIWKTGLYLPSTHTLRVSEVKFITDKIRSLVEK